jgi:poly(A) polymerase
LQKIIQCYQRAGVRIADTFRSSEAVARVDASWIGEKRTRAVTDMLDAAGHAALFVGGCVRNALLAQGVTDIDIATDAPPERVLALAAEAGLKAVPTGIEHGTVTVVSGHFPFEVTTFRRDVETDGRRAVVAFSDDIADDAARRDLTINALYARSDGTVLDPVGQGLRDLAARRVRFVGDPAVRIAEDYLRILRFFRFHAWYGNPERGLDPAGLAACAAAREGISRLSRERVGAETAKLLAARDPAPAVLAMASAGVLERVLPGADAGRLAALVRVEAAAGVVPRWQRRLAALGSAEAWGDRQRLSRADLKTLAAVARARAAGDRPAVLAYRYGADVARDAVLIAAAESAVPPPPDLEADLARGASARLPVRAADLPHLRGPALGAALRRLEAAWIASDFRLDRAALVAAAAADDPAPG